MMAKVGDVRYHCDINHDTGKIEFDEYVLRTIRKRYIGSKFRKPRLSITYGYWICKLKGITWVKRSKAHGDWGWADNIGPLFRERAPLDKPPYFATKRGALRAQRAQIVRWHNRYGDHNDDGELTYTQVIAKLDAAIKRASK